jgi:acetyltransferase-like isoleucine patch superfamily enzyme
MWRILERLEWELRRRLQCLYMARLRHHGIEIGPGASVVRGAALGPTVESVGAGTRIHRNCVLKGRSRITVGKYCDIAEGAHVVSSNHEINRANLSVDFQRRYGGGELLETRGPVRIGNGVWIGDNAVVLSGVEVGDGAVVSAGAIVTRSVEPFTIVAGVPAKAVRKRFDDEVIEELLALAWWDWPEGRLRASGALFEKDLTDADAAEFLRGLRSGSATRDAG